MARVEIKCNENGPELVVVDGRCLPQCVGVGRPIANRIVMEAMQK
jgi:hypothetical protein